MASANKQQTFQMFVEGEVKDGLSTYLDVITIYMEEHELEAKHVKKLISPTLEEKIKAEAIKNKLIQDDNSIGSKLPL